MTHMQCANPEQTWLDIQSRVRAGLMVRTHSARVQPGEVFVALPGTLTNGRMHVEEAVARGAGFVIAGPEPFESDSRQVKTLTHPDPRTALGVLAAAHHNTDRQCPLLVGVTGTNGKTTVTYLVEHLLRSSGRIVGLIGTIGARWPGGKSDCGMTTPDCWTLHRLLGQMQADGVEVVCMEVSSHALDQQRIAGLGFEVAVLTNITQDHLDYHGSMERYFQAKTALFAQADCGPRARVINADDIYGRRLLGQWGGLGYSLDSQTCSSDAGYPDACLHGQLFFCDSRGLGLAMTHKEQGWTIESSMVGRHNAANLLAAQGVGLCLGLTPEEMKSLEGFQGVPGRLERVHNDSGFHIFVDYAHTPDALDNVLRTLKSLDIKRLIVVFGCGGNRDRAKRPMMAQAVVRWADVVLLTSDNPRHEAPEAIMDDAWSGLGDCPAAQREVDRRKAIALALDLMRPGDALLVAGKGHEATQQIGETKIPFHDPTVIRELLSCA